VTYQQQPERRRHPTKGSAGLKREGQVMLMKTHVVHPRRTLSQVRRHRSARRHWSARRHFRNGRRAAVLRAITGAKLYLGKSTPTLADAAISTGSNVAYACE
jgi:hypothetical protein